MIKILLKKICSGGQIGADISGVTTAKKFGYETGGWMPKDFKTQNGNRPEYASEFNMKEHTSSSYVSRTFANIRDSDGTMRLAYNFFSPGEICTLKGIKQYGKPHLDINLHDPIPPADAFRWLVQNRIQTLNIAGNSEKTFGGTYLAVEQYLTHIFELHKKAITYNQQWIQQKNSN